MSDKSKKRLTLTASSMPDDVYEKLEVLGNSRKLTPYIVSLVQKEEQMERLINGLLQVTERMDKLENTISNLGVAPKETTSEIIKDEKKEEVSQGEINISKNIISGIDEEIEDPDF